MTLIEFLRARIDEDEEGANHSINGDLDYLPIITTKHGDMIYLGVTNPNRVLRECKQNETL